MNKNKKWFVFFLLMLGLVMAGTAVYADITATYTISKSVVAGGGHQNSTGGTYALSGTAGQAAAQTAVTGGDYSLTSGFWNEEDGNNYTATVQFNSATYSVAEDGNSVEISVVRSGSSSGDVTVNYATSNGTATAGSDYTATSGMLTWYFTNGTATKTFDIPIINDSAVENDETIMLTLSNPTSGATLGTNATATVTITDDDTSSAGKLQFSAATYSVAEDGGTATIIVSRTDGSTGAVSVQYATVNGTATAGSDYTAAAGTLNFANGVTSQTFTVSITDDSVTEGDETVIMTLTNPLGGATLGAAEAVLTITESGYTVYLPTITR